MGKYDKLIDKIKSLKKNLRFDELSGVLMGIGYIPKSPKSGSSHVTFRKPGNRPITIPRDCPINKVYVELVREAIMKHESEESEND